MDAMVYYGNRFMSIYRHILHWFQGILGRRRPSRSGNIAHNLDPETLARVMKEAETLQKHFQVNVQPMGKGELPIPRRADKEPHE
jgi:hypothetical protein